MPSPETLERFIARVEQNAHAEAIEEFYVEDGRIRENQAPASCVVAKSTTPTSS